MEHTTQNNRWIRKVNPEGIISSIVHRNEIPVGHLDKRTDALELECLAEFRYDNP